MIRPSMLRSAKRYLSLYISSFPTNSECIRPAEVRETMKFLLKMSVIRILTWSFFRNFAQPRTANVKTPITLVDLVSFQDFFIWNRKLCCLRYSNRKWTYSAFTWWIVVLDLAIRIRVPHIHLYNNIFTELNKRKVEAPTIDAEIKNSNSTRSHGATDPSNMTYV
jgi:hypothetical protein